MLSEAIALTLFPATMAFAAASDLLTMTIANRLSLVLVAGFAIVAVLGGLSATVLLFHLAAGAAVLAVAFFCFACRWIHSLQRRHHIGRAERRLASRFGRRR